MIVDSFLTNKAYGFPVRGAARRIAPPVLAVVHITGNKNNMGADAAKNERNFANRTGSDGPSAHYYINRDGSGIRAVAERFAAWSNGDINKPNVNNAGVQALLALRAKGLNINEGVYLETECVGTATVAGQWTDQQFDTVAGLIAHASIATGLPINRSTVLTHADINSVDRRNCAFLAVNRETLLARLISLAIGKVDGNVAQAPITDQTLKEITLAKGAKWFDLDGKTVLATNAKNLPWRPSPYGVGKLRAMFGGLHKGSPAQVVLVAPTSIRDVTPPAKDCTSEKTAAVADFRARTIATIPAK